MDKKAKERYQLDAFASLYPEFPDSSIVESEEPDFIVGKIGIEVTNYMHGQGKEGSNIRKSEVNKKWIIEHAKAKFEAICATPYLVTLIWKNDIQFQRSDVDTISTELANFVVVLVNQGSLPRYKADWHQLINTPLYRVVQWVTATPLPKTQKGFWSPAETGWPEISYEPLKQCVAAKEPKLPAYREKCKCASVWLLIVADGDGMSAIAEISPHIPPEIIETQFDRVFFFDLVGKHIDVLARNR